MEKSPLRLRFRDRLGLMALSSLQVFTWLPYGWQLTLGRCLGRQLLKRSSRTRRNALINLRLCFPGLTEQAYTELLNKNFESVGIGFFETILAAWGRDKQLQPLLHSLSGWDSVKETLASGQGAIILFPHLVPMYLIGRLLLVESQQPISLMYHSPKSPVLNEFLRRKLNHFCEKIFNRDAIRELVKYVRTGKLVWYAPDLDLGDKFSLFVPFFGVPAATLTAPMRLAKLTGAKIFPIAFYRRDEGGYDVTISPGLEQFPSGDDMRDLCCINQTIEDIVRQKPEQYLWLYKRFSTRPQGEVSPYKVKRERG